MTTETKNEAVSRGHERLEAAPFEGFNAKTRAWLMGAVRAVGLPSTNVERVTYKRHSLLGDLFGSKVVAEGRNKRVSLIRFIPGVRLLNLLISPHPYWLVIHSSITRDWVRKMEPASVISHELAHFCSPFNAKNDAMFGGRDNRLRVASFVTSVLRQSIATGVFINEYHRHVVGGRRPTSSQSLDRMSRLTIPLEETWAILVEQRFIPTDFDAVDSDGRHPQRHLKDVEDQQRAAITNGKNANGIPVDVVSIISRSSRVKTDAYNGESTEFEGVDDALALLIGKDKIKNVGDLLKHILGMRTYFKENQLSQKDWDEK